MLKNPDRSGGKPESDRRFCHALRSEAGGAFDISTRGGAKLAERSTHPREVERSWRSVRHIHESRSEAGGAFDTSTRGGAKLAERSRYPQEAERSWRSVRHIHERWSEAGEGADVSTRRDVKSPAYPNTFTPKTFFPYLSRSFS